MPGKARNRRQNDIHDDGNHNFEALTVCFENLTRASIDAPADPAGEWYFDLEFDGYAANVAWRAGRGFGIHASDSAAYGAGPDEIFRDAGLAARRLKQLAEAARTHRRPRMRLRDVRHLIDQPQTEIAGRLHVGQAVISRLENQNDAKLSTIRDYVEALGGRAELVVRFDGFEAPIDLSSAIGTESEPPIRKVPA